MSDGTARLEGRAFLQRNLRPYKAVSGFPGAIGRALQAAALFGWCLRILGMRDKIDA